MRHRHVTEAVADEFGRPPSRSRGRAAPPGDQMMNGIYWAVAYSWKRARTFATFGSATIMQ